MGSSNSYAQSASSWQAIDVAIGGDGKPRVLWTHPDGRMAVWTLGASGAVEGANQQGPYSGWTARKVAVGPDGKTIVMWTNTSGVMALHRINAQGVLEAHQEYGPFSDSGANWTGVTMSVDASNRPRVVWRRTDGYQAVWTVDTSLPAGAPQQQTFFGPSKDWSINQIGFDASGNARLRWNNSVDGRIAFWATDPALNPLFTPQYGPFAGWSPYALTVAGDGTSWLGWQCSDQSVALWHMDSNGNQTDTKFYGPYSGWQSKALALYPSPNNRLRVLWQYQNGGIHLWNCDASGVPDGALTDVYNAPPSGPSATGGLSKITLNWGASPNTAVYTIYRAASSNGPFAPLGTATGTTYTDTSAAGGNTYSYQVTATTGGVESGSSSIVSATATALAAPSNVTALAGNAQVSLSWTASADATSYSIKRSTTSSGPYTTLAAGVTGASYADTGLTNGTTYYYVVSASNTNGESPNSTQASATPVASPSATPTPTSGPTPTPTSGPAPTATPTSNPTPKPTPVPATIDARINTGTGTSWVGENIISATAQGEEASQPIEAGATATFFASVKRTGGNSGQSVRLSVPSYADFQTAGGAAHFFVSTQEITGDITSAQGYATIVGSGQEIVVRVEMTIPTSATPDNTQSLLVKAVDEDGSRTPSVDAVKATKSSSPDTRPWLERIEWSTDYVHWTTVSGPLHLLRNQSFGLRAVVRDPINHPWDESLDFDPSWTILEQGQTRPTRQIGEMIWVQATKTCTLSFAATGGRTLSGSVVVSADPDDEDTP